MSARLMITLLALSAALPAWFIARDIFDLFEHKRTMYPAPYEWELRVFAAGRLVLLLLALLIVLKRPKGAAPYILSAALISFSYANHWWFGEYSTNWYSSFVAGALLSYIGVAVGTALMIVFVLTFQGININRVHTGFLVLLGVLIACMAVAGACFAIEIIYGAANEGRIYLHVYHGSKLILYLVLVALCIAPVLRASPGSERKNLFVFVALALLAGGSIFNLMSLYLNIGLVAFGEPVDALCQIAAALLLAYMVLAHRLFDIERVIRRSMLVFIIAAFITIVLASVQVAADLALGVLWSREMLRALVAGDVSLVSSLFAEFNWGDLWPKFLGALVVALCFKRVEAWCQRGTDRLLSRGKRIRCRILQEHAKLVGVGDACLPRLDETLTLLRRTLDVPWVGFYRPSKRQQWRLRKWAGRTSLGVFSESDPLVWALRRADGCVELPLPASRARGSMAIPIRAFHQLVGVVVLGEREDHFDPDERQAIGKIGQALGDRSEADAFREAAASLRSGKHQTPSRRNRREQDAAASDSPKDSLRLRDIRLARHPAPA
jgi:hypothetical protein